MNIFGDEINKIERKTYKFENVLNTIFANLNEDQDIVDNDLNRIQDDKYKLEKMLINLLETIYNKRTEYITEELDKKIEGLI